MLFQTALFFSRAVFCATKLGCRTADGKKGGAVLFFVRTLLRMDGSGCLGCGGGWFLLLCCFAPLFCFLFLLSLYGKLGESQVLVLLKAMEEIFFLRFCLFYPL